MARRVELTDEPGIRIETFLPGRADTPGVTARDHRHFVDAVRNYMEFWRLASIMVLLA